MSENSTNTLVAYCLYKKGRTLTTSKKDTKDALKLIVIAKTARQAYYLAGNGITYSGNIGIIQTEHALDANGNTIWELPDGELTLEAPFVFGEHQPVSEAFMEEYSKRTYTNFERKMEEAQRI